MGTVTGLGETRLLRTGPAASAVAIAGVSGSVTVVAYEPLGVTFPTNERAGMISLPFQCPPYMNYKRLIRHTYIAIASNRPSVDCVLTGPLLAYTEQPSTSPVTQLLLVELSRWQR
eukprot:COSAG02_NODE_10843_length_1847_cov_2.298627_2_plen_116_part_00